MRRGDNPDGWVLQGYSWFIDQTIGGAVATGTHGSSLQHGSLSDQVRYCFHLASPEQKCLHALLHAAQACSLFNGKPAEPAGLLYLVFLLCRSQYYAADAVADAVAL